ncbi:MAG: nodulation protein NfeD [Acidimicrobiia bacterium]|nr:nodulation protein NfeD [Acidimicrobiia bacterium]
MTGGSARSATNSPVLLAEVDGPITPVVAEYLADAVDEAETRSAVLVVSIDTPGGLDVSMREIVQTFLNSPVPVVAYVSPEGSRAASAGTFITMAAHVATMAPATSIGAATPVDLQGGEITDKVINDAAAFAVSVAERRDRDVEFAEASVRDGTSITAREATETDVVDLMATDLDDLLAAIDGLTVEVDGVDTTLSTAGATVERFELSILHRILGRIADPNLAILLLSIGTLAIIYEAANPGLGFAGIAGAIAVILGFFALSVLPVTTAGVVLLILAVALFIGEVFVPGVGVMAAGGVIALLLSGLFLFEDTLSVSAPVLWPTALVLGFGAAYASRAVFKSRFAPPSTGLDAMLGRSVTVESNDGVHGTAFVDGTWWSVRAEDGVLEEEARIVAVDGLELVVQSTGGEHES